MMSLFSKYKKLAIRRKSSGLILCGFLLSIGGGNKASAQLIELPLPVEQADSGPASMPVLNSKALEKSEYEYQQGKKLCCTSKERPQAQIAASTVWLCRAALQGHSEAQYLLGEIYAGHYRVDDNHTKYRFSDAARYRLLLAAMWYDQAAKRGHIIARTAYTKIVSGLDQRSKTDLEGVGQYWRYMPCEYEKISQMNPVTGNLLAENPQQ
ncbi:MAG: hypothetical protein ACOYK8_02560 [Alphaproteobacteria bacterium]